MNLTEHQPAAPEPLTRDLWNTILDHSVDPQFEPKVRRRSRRYVIQAEAKLVFDDDVGVNRRIIRLVNASHNGLMGVVSTAVPLDTRVQIHLPIEDRVFSLTGRVVHSTPTIGGVKIGVRLVFDEPAAG